MILWYIRNWLRFVGELCITCVVGAFFVPDDFDGMPLHRRCRNCGKRFLGAWKLKRNYDECENCGYILTGNVTGRCSECGWKLTRRYRAHRKKVDTNP